MAMHRSQLCTDLLCTDLLCFWLGIQAQAFTSRGIPCRSVDMTPGDVGGSG